MRGFKCPISPGGACEVLSALFHRGTCEVLSALFHRGTCELLNALFHRGDMRSSKCPISEGDMWGFKCPILRGTCEVSTFCNTTHFTENYRCTAAAFLWNYVFRLRDVKSLKYWILSKIYPDPHIIEQKIVKNDIPYNRTLSFLSVCSLLTLWSSKDYEIFKRQPFRLFMTICSLL